MHHLRTSRISASAAAGDDDVNEEKAAVENQPGKEMGLRSSRGSYHPNCHGKGLRRVPRGSPFAGGGYKPPIHLRFS